MSLRITLGLWLGIFLGNISVSQASDTSDIRLQGRILKHLEREIKSYKVEISEFQLELQTYYANLNSEESDYQAQGLRYLRLKKEWSAFTQRYLHAYQRMQWQTPLTLEVSERRAMVRDFWASKNLAQEATQRLKSLDGQQNQKYNAIQSLKQKEIAHVEQETRLNLRYQMLRSQLQIRADVLQQIILPNEVLPKVKKRLMALLQKTRKLKKQLVLNNDKLQPSKIKEIK
jgi:hypothetical protein